MTNQVSFMAANFVARQLGYRMTRGWGQGEKAASEYLRPVETFGDRFEEILLDVRSLGFSAIDIWSAHLSPVWAGDRHIGIARDLLDKHDLDAVSFAGWFGSSAEEFEASCSLAAALGVPVLGGSTSMLAKDRAFVIERLKQYGLRLGIENHPEKTPGELLEKVGDGGDDTIGVTVDTGWFGTQGYDAAKAMAELEGHLFHVHLKDVREVGSHDSCRFGEGIVPLEECVKTLQQMNYTGALSVEHEPESFDPSEDSRVSREMLESWLGVAA